AGLQSATTAQVKIPDLVQPGDKAYLHAELIYSLTDRPTPQCHASTVVETPTGLVAAWFGGTRERNPDVGIWVSRFEGKAWSKPVEVANGVQSPDKRFPCWNPVLFQPLTPAPLPGGEKGERPLLLFYKVGPSPGAWWGMLTTSSDNGKT